MSVLVFWTDEAFKDLDLIFDFLAEQSPRAAKNTVRTILNRTKQLEQFPDSGSKSDAEGYQFLIESHFKIFYRHIGDSLYVEAIFDSRQHPNKLNLPT